MSDVDYRGKKVAFLATNGFCEREFVQAQRALTNMGMDCRLISVENALIQGWNEVKNAPSSHWGAAYAPDALLTNALPSDYDVLVIPGGIRSTDKLKLGANIKAFVSAFANTGKPVVAYNSAVDLLLFIGLAGDYTLVSTGELLGSGSGESEIVVSKNLITLARYTDVEDKIQRAVKCIISNEPYLDKEVSSKAA